MTQLTCCHRNKDFVTNSGYKFVEFFEPFFIDARKMNLYKVSNLTIWTISTIGCFIQLLSSIQSYFKYQSVTEAQYIVPQMITLPNLSICPRYYDISSSQKVCNSDHCDLYKKRDILDEMSLSTMFNVTPSPYELVLDVGIRRGEILSGLDRCYGEKSCGEYYTVDKFYTQEYMCYRVLHYTKPTTFVGCALATGMPGWFASYRLSKNISRDIQCIQLVVHSDPFPNFERFYTRYKLTYGNGFNMLISYTKYSFAQLGYPFNDYACGTYEEYFNCSNSCMIKRSLESFQKVPHNIVHPNGNDHLHITEKDVRKPGKDADLTAIISACKEECKVRPCSYDILKSSYVHDRDDNAYITIHCPESFFVSIAFVPQFSHLDILVYILSALGTWFGIVVIQLNPIKLFNRLKKYVKFITDDHSRQTKFDPTVRHRWMAQRQMRDNQRRHTKRY